MRSPSISPKRSHRARFDPAAFLQTVTKGRAISTHPKQSVIYTQGDAAESVFYIKSGKIKVTVVSKQGKEAVVAILGADEFLGEG
jgi:CRP-like cAMP-binding protein